MKNVILSADDYGQNEGISQAIIQLAERKLISATSCLVNMDYWKTAASLLRPYQDKIDIGLHFNLTEGKPLSIGWKGGQLPSLKSLLFQSFARLLNKAQITAELNTQIDAFVSAMGFLPNFIDGHQHIQLFPQIREIIVNTIKERFNPETLYIRCIWDEFASLRCRNRNEFKRVALQLLGGLALKKTLVKHNILHNQSFSGVYDLTARIPYDHLFPNFLQTVQNNGIIMCHPGTRSKDAIYEAREAELLYFMSSQFAIDCDRFQIKVSRFNGVVPSR